MLKKLSRWQKIALLAMVGLFMSSGPALAQSSLAVDFEWNGRGCATSKASPEIRVGNVPAGTAFLKVTLVDLDMPTYSHGGGTVEYSGDGLIKAGALKKGYKGPCPPSGSHNYEFTVKALDTDKKELASGKISKPYSK